MKRLIQFLFFLSLVSAHITLAQNVSWKRSETKKLNLQLFHSPQVFNLPTAETMQKGDFEFEISHRFIPPVTEGVDALYGLDGPVNMRLGLGYAITDRLVVTLARGNLDDNLDLQIKHKTFQFRNETFPILIGIQAGCAWNTQVENRENTNSRNFQYYGRVIFNTLYKKKIGIGFVPTYLYNSHIRCKNPEYSFTFGNYLQYYLSQFWSVIIEWNPTVTGFRKKYNSVSFGIELETGGHFFKILFTNNAAINPGQFTTGADLPFDDGDWRLGFNITRLIKL